MRRKGKEKPPSVEHTLCRLMNLGRQGQGQWQSWSRFNKTRVQFPKLSISFKFPKKSSLSKHYEWETIAFEFDCSRWKDVHTRTHIFRPFLSSSNPLHILSLSARFLLHMIVSFPFFPSPIPSLVVSIHSSLPQFSFFYECRNFLISSSVLMYCLCSCAVATSTISLAKSLEMPLSSSMFIKRL